MPGGVDAQLGLLATREGRVDAEQVGMIEAALAGAEPERPLDADAPGCGSWKRPRRLGRQRRRAPERGSRRDRAAQPTRRRPQRRRQLVGERDAHPAVGGVANGPRQVAASPAATSTGGRVRGDLEPGGIDGEGDVDQHHDEQDEVHRDQHGEQPVRRDGQAPRRASAAATRAVRRVGTGLIAGGRSPGHRDRGEHAVEHAVGA